jgi:beta-galactosidase
VDEPGDPSKALPEWHIEDGRLALPGLLQGPQLALWRAPTDNDRLAGLGDRWAALGLDRLAPASVEVYAEGRHAAQVTSVWPTRGGDVVHEQRFGPWELVDGEPALRCEERVVVPDGLEDLPRVGVVLQVSDALNRMSWFGPGPWETYPDRQVAPVGLWTATVDELATPYATGQEAGGRHGVRWLRLDGADHGLQLTFDRPLQVNVSGSTAQAIAASRSGQDPERAGGLLIHLDVAHRGLGTASCGPDVLPAYRTEAGIFTWTWWLRAW